METFRAKVFRKDGNRFLVPGYWYEEDDPDASPSSLSLSAMMFAVVCKLDVDKDWLELEATGGVADLPNAPYRIVGPQFEHGAVDVLLISGPLFDEVLAEAQAA
jgi:hypothetical protein